MKKQHALPLPEPAQPKVATAATVPQVSLPISWFRDPLDEAIKKVVRPSTALTRRKELVIKMKVPREVFEDFMSPLQPADCGTVANHKGLSRDPVTNKLVPTKTTSALHHFKYEIERGGVSNRLFHLQTLDPPTPKPPKPRMPVVAPLLLAVGEEDVFEVETILDCRPVGRGNKKEYLIKWVGWDGYDSWEPAGDIHPELVATFHGQPPAVAVVTTAASAPAAPSAAPSILKARLVHRGAGCARGATIGIRNQA